MAIIVQDKHSSDCDDLSTDVASSCGLNDALTSSGSDSDDAPPKRPTALRLGARCYYSRDGEVGCVLGTLMTFLRSIPTVRHVAQECSGGKSVRYLVTMPAESIMHADEVLMGAQQTLLSAAYNSQNVYVMGHARDPFTSLGVRRWGFQGQLCMVNEQFCMDALDFGRCNRWCPHTVCRRKHPQASHLTDVIVEIQVSCGLPPGLTEAGPLQMQGSSDFQFIVDAEHSMKHRFASCRSL